MEGSRWRPQLDWPEPHPIMQTPMHPGEQPGPVLLWEINPPRPRTAFWSPGQDLTLEGGMRDAPIVDVGAAALAGVDPQGEQAEDKEEAGHAEADTVHCRVAHQLLTRITSLDALADVFEEWNLREKEAGDCRMNHIRHGGNSTQETHSARMSPRKTKDQKAKTGQSFCKGGGDHRVGEGTKTWGEGDKKEERCVLSMHRLPAIRCMNRCVLQVCTNKNLN